MRSASTYYKKKMMKAIRMATAIIAVMLTVVLSWQQQDCVLVQQVPEQPQSAVMSPQKQHHHEATLSDASQLYRICSSRPQRIMPSHGSKTERTTTPCGSWLRRTIVKPQNPVYDSRCRLETAPFCLAALRNYYVIALRHIIR